jgi:predicted transposase YdaD
MSEPARSGYANQVLAATKLVMGLRYSAELIHQLLGDNMGIEESVIYQEILQKGEAQGEARGEAIGALKEARKVILKLGQKRFGVPDDQVKKALKSIVDIAAIERLWDKLLAAKSWEELLDLPRPRRRKRGD